MENNDVHFRHLMLYYFRKSRTPTETLEKILKVYVDATLSLRTVQRWFKRFQEGDFDLEDRPRSGRPSVTEPDPLVELLQDNARLSVREMSELLGLPKSTIHDHLRKLKFVARHDVWVPHDLTERNLIERISVCDTLLQRFHQEDFLKQIVTGDEKWVLYANPKRKKAWLQPGSSSTVVAKPGLYPKKMLLCVWWNWQGVLHYELLPQGETVTAAKYCLQLNDLKAAIAVKHPALLNRRRVVFHHDNARPHVALSVREKLIEFDWDVLPHPPYSPDLAPSDYHLFRSMQHSLSGEKFASPEGIKNHLNQYFASQPSDFYQKGIWSLPNRWRKVIELRGHYNIE
jgi:histone-lysine N-methyltransferase SETMAR